MFKFNNSVELIISSATKKTKQKQKKMLQINSKPPLLKAPSCKSTNYTKFPNKFGQLRHYFRLVNWGRLLLVSHFCSAVVSSFAFFLFFVYELFHNTFHNNHYYIMNSNFRKSNFIINYNYSFVFCFCRLFEGHMINILFLILSDMFVIKFVLCFADCFLDR